MGNYFINTIQMSELAVTFQGTELPRQPPVESMRVEKALHQTECSASCHTEPPVLECLMYNKKQNRPCSGTFCSLKNVFVALLFKMQLLFHIVRQMFLNYSLWKYIYLNYSTILTKTRSLTYLHVIQGTGPLQSQFSKHQKNKHLHA